MVSETIQDGLKRIPEFYYDLIARIPAGALLLAGTAVGYFREDTWAMFLALGASWAASTAAVGVLTMFSYVAGILLSGIGDLLAFVTRWITWHRLQSNPTVEAFYDYAERIELLKQGQRTHFSRHVLPTFRRLHDELKRTNAEASVILPKMSAEAALCHNVLSCCLVLIVAGRFEPASFGRPGEVLVASTAALATLSGFQRTYAASARTLSYLNQDSRLFAKAELGQASPASSEVTDESSSHQSVSTQDTRPCQRSGLIVLPVGSGNSHEHDA